MQPTYLPWSGYFNLIANSDHFVFLDDVEYSKNSFHNRNRYLLNGKNCWITVPVLSQKSTQLIMNSELDESSKWRKKHISLLECVYNKHGHFKDFFVNIQKILEDRSLSTISDVNMELIIAISRYFKFNTTFHRSSTLKIEGARTERLVNICKNLGCDSYFSPSGSKEYILEDGDFVESGIDLIFQEFTCEPYKQKNAVDNLFVSHLSVVDLIANIGKDKAESYIRNGFQIEEGVTND